MSKTYFVNCYACCSSVSSYYSLKMALQAEMFIGDSNKFVEIYDVRSVLCDVAFTPKANGKIFVFNILLKKLFKSGLDCGERIFATNSGEDSLLHH